MTLPTMNDMISSLKAQFTTDRKTLKHAATNTGLTLITKLHHDITYSVCVHAVPLQDPETLQELKIPIVSDKDCSAAYPWLSSKEMCAGYKAGGKDTCTVSFTI